MITLLKNMVWGFTYAMLLFLMMGLLCKCAGPSFESASLATSPGDGDPSEDSLTGSDSARDSGLDATPGEVLGDAVSADMHEEVSRSSPDADTASSPSDSHIDDPWPADVVIERMPAPNCFITFAGSLSCCFGPNMPPVDCENQNQAHYCDQCPK